jgi:hypothetical protein
MMRTSDPLVKAFTQAATATDAVDSPEDETA